MRLRSITFKQGPSALQKNTLNRYCNARNAFVMYQNYGTKAFIFYR